MECTWAKSYAGWGYSKEGNLARFPLLLLVSYLETADIAGIGEQVSCGPHARDRSKGPVVAVGAVGLGWGGV